MDRGFGAVEPPRRERPRGLVAATCVAAVALWSVGGASPIVSAAEPEVRATATESRTLTFVDTTRPTPSNGSYSGSPTRAIDVRVTVQDGAGSQPLLIWDHGQGVPITSDDFWLRRFVNVGYVVAVIDHPLTRNQAPGDPTPADRVNQPRDISFVLDRLLESAGQRGNWLHDRIDATRIGAAGESIGGYSVLGLLNSCCSELRIKAIAADAPALVDLDGRWILPGSWFTKQNPPLLMTAGTVDQLFAPSRSFFESSSSPKYFVAVSGGQHRELREGSLAQREALYGSLLGFFDAYVRGDAEGLSRLGYHGNTPDVTTCTGCPERRELPTTTSTTTTPAGSTNPSPAAATPTTNLAASLDVAHTSPKAKGVAGASGRLTASLSGGKLTWRLSYVKLTAKPTAKLVSDDRKVAVLLCSSCGPNAVGTVRLDATQERLARDGKLAAELTTSRNPKGEVRGPLRVMSVAAAPTTTTMVATTTTTTIEDVGPTGVFGAPCDMPGSRATDADTGLPLICSVNTCSGGVDRSPKWRNGACVRS